MQSATQAIASPNVIIIPPTVQNSDGDKLLVAAYCRVSSNSADQLNSYAAQISHYTHLAKSHPEWNFVDVYADEGISGLKSKNRPEFQRLLADCRAGRVKRILTKSISRFSRNTVDCLESLRELTLLGVSVLFEEQNLDTAVCKGEVLVSFLSSLAQKESLSISTNLKLGNRMRMQQGKYVSSSAPFGYRLVDKKLEVYEPEAEIVRQIYQWYLSGIGLTEITNKLAEISGDVLWRRNAVTYLLTNQYYTGDVIWQKTYTTDTLPLQRFANNGERDQYYVKNHHPAIVARDDFENVQLLFNKRSFPKKAKTVNLHPFRSRIQCKKCGTILRRVNVREKTYWVCRNHAQNRIACSQKQIPQTSLESAFCILYNKLKNNPTILETMLSQLQSLRTAKSSSNAELAQCNRSILTTTEQLHRLTGLHAKGLMDDALFLRQQNSLNAQLTKLRQQKSRLLEVDDENDPISATKSMITVLEQGVPYLWSFDETLFSGLIKAMTATTKEAAFHLHNGLILKEVLP